MGKQCILISKGGATSCSSLGMTHSCASDYYILLNAEIFGLRLLCPS